jgi:hypothetical protein
MMLAAVMTLRSSLKEVWPRRTFAVSCGLAGLALTLMPYGLLRAYYPDPAYSPTRADYRAAADYLAQAARPGDAIVIRSRVEPLWNYFINYVYSPVEWYAYEPVVPTDTPPDSVLDEAASAQLLNPETEQLFDEILPQQHARVWHVSDQCADWTFLHLEERWLAKHYAAATSHSFQAQCTTLVSPFALAAAPVDQGAGGIFQFGEAIRLTGFARLAFSEGAPVRPGDILPLRLDWQLVQPVSMDYSIGVYLLDAGGALKAQQDGSARGGFLPMTHWPLNAAVSDQHGLDLPNGLPAGEYQVAVAVYNWQTGERLAVTGATGPAPAGLARLLTVHVGP